MMLCADYIDLIQKFGIDVAINDAVNPIVRHVTRAFGYDPWPVSDDAFTRDSRYRRGLANAARELRNIAHA